MPAKLAFVCHTQNRFYQEVLLGVVEAVDPAEEWRLSAWRGNHMVPPTALPYLELDAVVTTSWDREELPGLPPEVPVLGISNAKAHSDFPRVVNDDMEAGRLAAETMIDAGYERLLILNNLDHHHVQLRCEGARDAARRLRVPLRQVDCALRRPADGESFAEVFSESRQLLSTLTGEVRAGTGVLATQIDIATDFMSMLENGRGPRIPSEIGVLLLDLPPRDETRLAYVDLNGREIGRRAARRLFQHRRDGTLPPPGSLAATPPLGVRTGHTVRCGEGVLLYQQLHQHFNQHLAEEIRIDKVARALGQSRRSLEMKLKAERLPAPYELLTRMRLTRAEDLLRENELSSEEIALKCGFANARSLSERFRSRHGITPFAYRKRAREGGEARMARDPAPPTDRFQAGIPGGGSDA